MTRWIVRRIDFTRARARFRSRRAREVARAVTGERSLARRRVLFVFLGRAETKSKSTPSDD